MEENKITPEEQQEAIDHIVLMNKQSAEEQGSAWGNPEDNVIPSITIPVFGEVERGQYIASVDLIDHPVGGLADIKISKAPTVVYDSLEELRDDLQGYYAAGTVQIDRIIGKLDQTILQGKYIQDGRE